MEAALYFLGAAVLAVPATALLCRLRQARRRRVSFGTVLSGALIAAAISYGGMLIYAGGTGVFTVAFWLDPKQSPSFAGLLHGLAGTALPCALSALGVVAYYQAKRKREQPAAAKQSAGRGT